jgi:hypothetical protein
MGNNFFETLVESESVRIHFHQSARAYGCVLADHVARSRQVIAASRDLLVKVDRLLERDGLTFGGVKRGMLQEHFVQAERHIALGERHLARQRGIVAVLEFDGFDTGER